MRTPIDRPYKVTIKAEYKPVIRAAMEAAKAVNIIKEYDIPYVAGASNDGKTVYWDRHFPYFVTYKGGRVSIKLAICTHELVEKALMDTFKLPYLKAHYIATDMEATVIAKTRLPWEYYDTFCRKYIKTIGHEQIKKAPRDLYLQPYIQYHDEKDVKKLKQAMV